MRAGGRAAELPVMSDFIAKAVAALALSSVPAFAGELQNEFAVRADLSQAEAIAPVLARIGEPVLYPIPEGKDPKAALTEICGARSPPILEMVSEPSPGGAITYARAVPCVRRLHNVVAFARVGDTLETIAVRLGMRPSSSSLLRVLRDKSPLRRMMKTDITRGDRVIAALAPDWSVIRPRSGTITTRMELVEQIATAMKCGAEEVNSCLLRRSVLVTERTRRPAGTLQSRAGGDQPAPDSPGSPTSLPAGPLSAVAAGQWPYDAELVRLLLKEVADAHLERPVLIGIADNGLNDASGKPLASSQFGKTYDTGAIGGGAPRDDRNRGGTDDVSLCNTPPVPPFASWQPPGLETASHGAIVSSIATGNSLRSDATTAALPQLLFYRIVRNACTADSGMDPVEEDLINGAEFLTSNDIKVLNMSQSLPPDKSSNLVYHLNDLLHAPSAPMLVAAAGNFTGDLDSVPSCPACLANPERHGDVPHYRIIAVGAAERSLHAADYSGHGDKTVRLYAPAEPAGAIDIDGHDASGFQSATSYATPLVSLAIGLAYALGMEDPAKIRNRLLLSTWQLLGDDGKPVGNKGGPLDIGVLDLLRMAAVRHTSVETLQPGPDGHPVRRTYVGRITDGLVKLCPGTAINAIGNQAIRFGESDANGLRDAAIALFKPDHDTLFPPMRHATCASSGTLTIEALRDGVVSVPASSVTQILLPVPLH